MLQMPIFDVLIFGEKGVGKKSFMQQMNEGQKTLQIKKTITRDEHFKYFDYIKMTVTLPTSSDQINMRLWRQTTESRGFTSPQLNNAVCAVYLLDLTKSEAEITEKLLKHRQVLIDTCRPDIISLLIGNKSDNPDRKIKKNKAR